ncbi:MAG TPA: exonuclease domain-containing protein [Ignavibacteriaceae bacterium]|nr:exonuclease domain-containing protein [Ignavibacteriaceae bacterium]
MNEPGIFELPLSEADFCVFDVETTGVSPRYNNIIEIGIVKISKLKITETYHTLINPKRAIPNYITRFTGISDEDVYNAPFFEDAAADICRFISNSVLTAHNISFDKSFLRRELAFSGLELSEFLPDHSGAFLCTLRLAKRLYPRLRSCSLNSVGRHLRLKNKRPHRALPDAEVTALILLKMIKQAVKKEKIRTIGELINFQFIPQVKEETNLKLGKQLGKDIAGLPDMPGVYYFLNSRNEIIYIGKAKSLRDRIRSYFSVTAPRKAKKIVKQAVRLKIEITNSELTALLFESESIKKINPRHNVMLKHYGNSYFLKITTSHEFPTLDISNYFDFDGNDYFGLFVTKKKALELWEMVSRTFSLRECTDEEFSRGRGCFLAEIERCTAPCLNKDKQIYSDELDKVYQFLYGKNQYALNRLINKMKDYSDKQKYEKAAEIKSLIDLILSQTHKSSLLAEPVNSARVLFEINEGYRKDYVLMIEGKIYVKKQALKESDDFETAIDDYFENSIKFNNLPDEKDLEKMKITLNWFVKNRNKIRAFYLKNYINKKELYSHLTSYGIKQHAPVESIFDIKNLIKEERVELLGVDGSVY